MHTKERVPRVLAAVAGTARAMRRHKRRTLAAGVALLLVGPLVTGAGYELFALNAVGLGIGALIVRGQVRRRREERAHRLWLQRRAEREEDKRQQWLKRREQEADQTAG